MRLTILTSTVLVISLQAAWAEDCKIVVQDLDRLACYDYASGRTPEVTTSQPSGNWIVLTEKSAITDDTNVIAALHSKDAVKCNFSRDDTVDLSLRCVEKTTFLTLDTSCHMTSSDYNSYGDVTYRIDDEKAKTVGMDASTDNRSLGLWTGGKSIPLIKALFGKHRLIVRMLPYGQNQITANFDISGLEEAIKPLRAACGW